MTSFKKRRIDVTLTLQNKTFADQTDKNTVELKGFRVLADIQKVGQFSEGSKCQIKIYGMQQKDMASLSLLTWAERTIQLNQISVFAGDEDGMSEVFSGQITKAWADYSSAPDVCLVLEGIPAFYEQIKEAPATSYPNGVDVAQAMKDLALKMGLEFKNNGVTAKLPASYFPSTLLKQARTIAKHAGILMIVDNKTLTISPIGSAIEGEIAFLGPETGLVGYPSWSSQGISIRALYDPAIKFGGKVKVDGSIDIANGEWTVINLKYQLESEKQNGAWFCNIDASRYALGQSK